MFDTKELKERKDLRHKNALLHARKTGKDVHKNYKKSEEIQKKKDIIPEQQTKEQEQKKEQDKVRIIEKQKKTEKRKNMEMEFDNVLDQLTKCGKFDPSLYLK